MVEIIISFKFNFYYWVLNKYLFKEHFKMKNTKMLKMCKLYTCRTVLPKRKTENI